MVLKRDFIQSELQDPISAWDEERENPDALTAYAYLHGHGMGPIQGFTGGSFRHRPSICILQNLLKCCK